MPPPPTLSLATSPHLGGHPHAPLIDRAARLSAAAIDLAARMRDADALQAESLEPGSPLVLVHRELSTAVRHLAGSLGQTMIDLDGACRELEAAGLLGAAEQIRQATREGMQDGDEREVAR